jgi:hypothetical protein
LFCVRSVCVCVCVSVRLDSQSDERVATPYPLRPCSTHRAFSLVLEETSFLPEEVLHCADVTSVKESLISHSCSHGLIFYLLRLKLSAKKRQSVRRFVLLAITRVEWLRVIMYNTVDMVWKEDVEFSSVLCKEPIRTGQTQQLFI